MNLNVLKYKINKRLVWLFGDTIYNSYSEALKDCVSNGYENSAIINFAQEKTKLYRQNIANGVIPHVINLNIFPLLSLINELAKTKKSINIIDFGGGDGGHYLLIRQLLSSEIRLKWQVVETPEMAKGMKAFETDELSFSDNLDDTLQKTEKINILYTSGTLQYTPNPYQFIQKMLDSDADYVVFNRQSMNANDRDLITIQRSLLSWHGSNDIKTVQFVDREIRYPHTNISLVTFEAIALKKHAIVQIFDDASGVKKVNKEKIVGRSYILKKL
jgi:putative methyltransferase (TIGR04325 family)